MPEEKTKTAKDTKPTPEPTIAYGVQDPYKVYLPIEKVEVTLRLATGMDGFVTAQRFKKLQTIDAKQDEGVFLTEVIARCITNFPKRPEFGVTAQQEVTFNHLLFLRDIDIKVLKMAHVIANMPDPATTDIINSLALGYKADALQQALWLTRELNGGITLDAALQLPEKVRWEMLERVQVLLGIHDKQKPES